MIITLDIGNSNIKVGIFKDGKVMQYARFATDIKRTSDEYGLQLVSVFEYSKLDILEVEGVIISSVVPTINYTIEHMCRTFLHVDPMLVGPGMKTGLNIMYENPREVGSDRIVTSVAAYAKYGGPVIVVDFGTATTYNVIDAEGRFLGGAIMPGIKVSMEALVSGAAKLPRIELQVPDNTIGKTTVANMQSGIINGYVGSVQNIVIKMKEELGSDKVAVIATGGLSKMIAEQTDIIDKIDPRLTLEGLYMIYQKNLVE